jgi:hypothetical protein
MEFGTTTGRPRRCGWLDIVALKYCCQINGFSSLNLTKLDVLTGLKEVKLGISYCSDDGKTVESFPADLDLLEQIKVPVLSYEFGSHCRTLYTKTKVLGALDALCVFLDNSPWGLCWCRSNMRFYLGGRMTFPQYVTTTICLKLLASMSRE